MQNLFCLFENFVNLCNCFISLHSLWNKHSFKGLKKFSKGKKGWTKRKTLNVKSLNNFVNGATKSHFCFALQLLLGPGGSSSAHCTWTGVCCFCGSQRMQLLTVSSIFPKSDYHSGQNWQFYIHHIENSSKKFHLNFMPKILRYEQTFFALEKSFQTFETVFIK